MSGVPSPVISLTAGPEYVPVVAERVVPHTNTTDEGPEKRAVAKALPLPYISLFKLAHSIGNGNCDITHIIKEL
jgi:hypothetical protein